jgi:hypothetical protein
MDFKTNVRDFMPHLETQVIEFQLHFPVQNFANILKDVEERLCYETGALFSALYREIEDRIKVFGPIKTTMVYDEIFIGMDCADRPFEWKQIRDSVAESCRIFWNRYNLHATKEVKGTHGGS